MRNRWLSVLVALVLAFGAGIATVAVAQTTGDIEGTVVDSNGAALPGVSVEIKSPALLGSRVVVTDGAGRYRFPALPPGTYTATASLSGFTKVEKTGVSVALGRTANLPITLSVSVKEEVVVTGEAPVVDVTKTTIGTTANADTIQKLPLGRNFTAIASTVAGTGTDAAGGVTVYGATSLENQYVIDGVNTTGVKVGDQGKTLNQEFVQEVEVKTGGYEAEYGRALGGVINVVTKSGGNEFHGDAFGYYDSSSLASSDDHSADRTAVGASQFIQPKRLDFGADLGGYFVKDRLWFFGAFDRVQRDQDYTRVSRYTYVPLGTTPQTYRVDSTNVGGTDENRTNLFSGKLTFRLGESNTVAVSVFGDPQDFSGRISGTAGPDTAVLGDVKFGGTDVSAKWDGIFGTQFLGQIQYGHHEDSSQQSSPYANTLSIAENRLGFTQFVAGSGPALLRDEKYKRDAVKASGTFFLGTNEIKAGVDYESLNSSFSEQYGGKDRIFKIMSSGGSFAYAYHRYFAVVPLNCTDLKNGQHGNFGPVGPGTASNTCAGYQVANSVDNEPKTRNLAIFAQDSFKVLPNLTINAGIRWEQQKLLDANGSTAIKLDNEWAPRLGIVFDPLKNGRSKIYASYGRFYEIIPQDIQTRALGNEYTVFSYNYTGDALNPVTDPAFFSYGYPTIQGGELVQDGLKGMYQDEIIGGVEYEFMRNWSFGLKGIYKSLGRSVEDRCDLLDPRVHLDSYLPPGALTTCALVNIGEGNGLGNIQDPNNPACVKAADANGQPTDLTGACETIHTSRIYRGVEATVTHRFSNNFYFLASYLYSKLQGNYSGNLSQTREGGQLDPNINADYDYVDLTPNSFGRLRNDRKHQFKLSGLYSFPFGLQVGVNSSFATGRPMSIRGYARPGYSQERYFIARGSWYDLPSTYQVDLHLEYGLRIGQVTISPVVDIFNVTNFQGVTSRDELYCSTRPNFPARNGSTACPALGAQTTQFVNNYLPNPGQTGGDINAQNTPSTPRPYLARANFNRDISWQAPRVIRLGARISF